MSKILGPLSSEPENSLNRKQRYAYLQRLFLTASFVAVILPVAVVTILSFLQYRDLLQRESDDKLNVDALSAKQSYESHIEQSLSTMVVVSQGYQYGDLFDQQQLLTLFKRLKDEYDWVVDLSVLDSTGVQRSYVGPYPLQGINYSDQEWFLNAVPRKTYVSDIFTGYRGVPHFVITVTNGDPGSTNFWMLRASIDSQQLSNYIKTINTDVNTDMFLVGPDGTLRTQSASHGRIGDPYNVDLSLANTNITLAQTGQDGARISTASTRLEGMPWTLVLERRGYVYGDNWDQFRMQYIALVVICSIAALYIIFRVTRFMVSMIRRADDRRDETLAEAQHTARLASVGQLAAGVAHEINNPLAIINEKIGLIRDLSVTSKDFEQKERFITLADSAEDAVKRCKDITHRLLGFARRMNVEKESLKLNDVVTEVVSFVEREALYRDIKVELDLSDDMPAIQSDRGQLQQIFLNMVNNAMDAVEHDGVVTIKTDMKNPRRVRATVSDTGPGIPHNIMKHIFEPFFTTKIKNETSGTGLGLSITYGLVKKLCGRINVESPPGKGAIFTVEFPVDCDLED